MLIDFRNHSGRPGFASVRLAYSRFPDIVMGTPTIWEARAVVKSLQFTLVGVVLTVPTAIAYTIMVYRIFHGKITGLRHE